MSRGKFQENVFNIQNVLTNVVYLDDMQIVVMKSCSGFFVQAFRSIFENKLWLLDLISLNNTQLFFTKNSRWFIDVTWQNFKKNTMFQPMLPTWMT